MTLKDLQGKVYISKTGYGNYKVAVRFRNKTYAFSTTDSEVFDRIHNSDADTHVSEHGLTLKQAYEKLYNKFSLYKMRGEFSRPGDF